MLFSFFLALIRRAGITESEIMIIFYDLDAYRHLSCIRGNTPVYASSVETTCFSTFSLPILIYKER